MLPFRTNVIDIEGDKIQFTIGADQKISVKNPRIKASEDFTCALARVIIEIPQHLDIYSQLSPEVDKDTGEIDESAKELNRFVAISKITFGLDDFGEYVDIVLTMKAKNFTKRMKVDVPRAYLRNSDEMQMDMFPVETENHLIELRRQCDNYIAEYLQSIKIIITTVEMHIIEEIARPLVDQGVTFELRRAK